MILYTSVDVFTPHRRAALLRPGLPESRALSPEITGGVLWHVVRAQAGELGSDPLRGDDAKIIAVARGLQVAGILLCVMDDKKLEHCDCFIDLVRTETEERVKQSLIAGVSDWTNLARYQPRDAQAVR